jgi:hypothetical protein
MSDFIRHFTHITKTEKQNPLLYLFLLETLVWGVAFAFFSAASPVTDSFLHMLTVATFGSTFAFVWGIMAILAVLGSLAGIYLRRSWLGQAVSLTGFCIWLYATIMYISGGYMLHLFAVALPNLLFWLWWFFLIQGYHRRFGK